MKVGAEFRSDLFPADPDEEGLINPGRFGRRLALFLAEGLRARGFEVIEPSTEDWGWYLEIRGLRVPFIIGVGNVDGEPNQFRAFLDPSTPVVKKFPFIKIDIAEDAEKLSAAFAEILESEPGIRDLTWGE